MARRRSRNPSALVAALVTLGAAAAVATAVAIAMVKRRDLAKANCNSAATLGEVLVGTIGGLT